MHLPTEDRTAPPAQAPRSRHETVQTTLAAGGLLAAFGVASCCALPVAFSMLGLGTASLVGIGIVAAQIQPELFYLALVCLAGAGVALWRSWNSKRACPSDRPVFFRILDWAGVAALVLTVGLLALTFWIEPPI